MKIVVAAGLAIGLIACSAPMAPVTCVTNADCKAPESLCVETAGQRHCAIPCATQDDCAHYLEEHGCAGVECSAQAAGPAICGCYGRN